MVCKFFLKKQLHKKSFFHTFNTLHLDGKQIILSANCPPAELQAVEPRLISRFEWGIVLNLFPLNKELQVKMLQQKAEFLQFPLHLKVIDFLIETFTSSPKSLIKALEALVLRIHLNGQHAKIQASGVTVPLAKQVLRDLILDEKKHQLTFEKTIQYTAQVFGIKSDDILGKSQTKECVLSRQLAMYFCRHRLKLSYTKIGELFSKDHSTVMSSVKVIQKNLDENQNDVMGYYNAVQKMIDNPLASQENLPSTEDQ
jgi:chromosomal replication initiator protein